MHIHLFTLIACMSAVLTLHSAPDCLDDSNSLSQAPDYKELHYVACNHDCYKDPQAHLDENQGRCSVCGHYHIPRPLVVVKTQNPKSITAPTKRVTPKNTLAHLLIKKNR